MQDYEFDFIVDNFWYRITDEMRSKSFEIESFFNFKILKLDKNMWTAK